LNGFIPSTRGNVQKQETAGIAERR
jgi:hypothetical protein